MKKAILTAILVLTAAFGLFYVNAAVTNYKIDVNHSNIGFAVPILDGMSKVRGKFTDFSVDIVYDERDVTKSSVNVVIKAGSINTGIDARDKHLRTADFFDVENFPEITFQSKRIEKKGKQFIAHGTFTMHGVTKEIAIPFTITGVSKIPGTDKTNLGVAVNLKINRQDYGIKWKHSSSPNFVGDVVEIELNLITRAAAASTEK
jgi:polyisoprenoid-binding protein YceI